MFPQISVLGLNRQTNKLTDYQRKISSGMVLKILIHTFCLVTDTHIQTNMQDAIRQIPNMMEKQVLFQVK